MDQDNQQRSIRRITRPGIRTGRNSVQSLNLEKSSREYRSKRRSSFGMWVSALIILIILFLAFSIVFAGTKIVVHPKQETINVDGLFSAKKQAGAYELQYEIMTITKEASKTVPAEDEKFVEEKASGEIIIYNDFGSISQRLIANTRFETPEGLVYRIKNSIVVPGKKTVEGKSVPGSLTVRVYADDVGEEYNIGLTEFTIPGLKGSSKYSKFYAESKTPMTGGFSGLRNVVSNSDKEEAITELQRTLDSEIRQQAFSEKPEGFILYDDGIYITYEELPDESVENGVTVNERAVLKAILFDGELFARHLAESSIANYDSSEVIIDNPQSFEFVIQNDPLDLNEGSEVEFQLSGENILVWQFDVVKLKSDLLGVAKRDVDSILLEYPSIEKAEVIIRPFWKRSFPNNPKDIKVEID